MNNEMSGVDHSRQLIEEAEQTLRAIQYGTVDAFVVEEPEGHRVYTLEGSDLPYSSLVEKIQQGAAMLDAHGCIVYCNLSLAQLLDVPRETVIGRVLRDFIAAEDRPAYERFLRQNHIGSSEGEMSLQLADGNLVSASFSFSLLSGDKSATGVLITDLTSQKQHMELASRLRTANRKLREAQAELVHINPVMTMGKLVASIVHEVKQPLATIVNKANAGICLLATQSPDFEEVQQALGDIAEQGRMVGDVISRIRAQVKKAEPAKAEVDINQSIQERSRRSQDVQSWKQLYRAAVLETNMELIPRRILEARKAAAERAVHMIGEASDDEPELQDLVYASAVLIELNRRWQSGRH